MHMAVSQFRGDFLTPNTVRRSTTAKQTQRIKADLLEPAPLFRGIHPDAVVGADMKVIGSRFYPENTNQLFQMLKDNGQLESKPDRSYQVLGDFPLRIHQTRKGGLALFAHHKESNKDLLVGFPPKEVAAEIIPLMKKGVPFHATLTRIKPYQTKEQWHHVLEMRFEHITKPDKAPYKKLAEQVENTLHKLYRKLNGDMIHTIIPESIHLYKVNKKTLVERWDQERRELTYYTDGQLITRVQQKGRPEDPVKIDYRVKVPKSIQTMVEQLVHLIR